MKYLMSRVGSIARPRRLQPEVAPVPAWRPVFYKTLSVHLLETTYKPRRRWL